MANCLQCPVRVKDTSGLHGCHHAVPDNAGDSQSDSMNSVLTFLFPSLLLAPQQRQGDRSWQLSFAFLPRTPLHPSHCSYWYSPGYLHPSPSVRESLCFFLSKHVKSCRQCCDAWVRILIWCILFACNDIGFFLHLKLMSQIVLQLFYLCHLLNTVVVLSSVLMGYRWDKGMQLSNLFLLGRWWKHSGFKPHFCFLWLSET